MGERAGTFEVEALGAFGAELRGVDLASLAASGAEPESFKAFEAALLRYGVLVIRDQKLEPDEQVALGRLFGSLEGQEFSKFSPFRDLIVIGNVDPEGCVVRRDNPVMRMLGINEVWHTDSSFRDIPASVSIFAAKRVPPVGGDTFFASMRVGWLDLPEAEREALRGRIGVHDYDGAYRRSGGGKIPDFARNLPPKHHPIVRTHPRTGEPSLFVSGHACAVEGLSPEEGKALIEKLVAWCTREGRTLRHRWREGDVVLWDNRCVLHRAQGFDDRHARVMHHVRVAGIGPVEAY